MAKLSIAETTRREAFAALGATGLAGVAGLCWARSESITATPKAAVGDDRALLALIAELEATDIAYRDTNEPWSHFVEPAPDHVEEALSALARRGWDLRRQIGNTPSLTLAGMVAKSRITKEQILAFGGSVGLDANELIIVSLCDDIASASAGASA